MFRRIPLLAGIAALLILTGTDTRAQEEAIKPEEVNLGRPVDFEQDVFPILDANCIACHNLAIKENGLNLEDVENILKGGKRGPSLVAKDPDKSLLFQVASRGIAPAMPPLPNKVEAKALTPKELGILRQWILEGAGAGAGSAGMEVKWQAFPANLNSIFSLAMTQDGQYVASGRGNRITIYHVPTGTEVARLVDASLKDFVAEGKPIFGEFPAHRDFVHALAFNPAGDTLASGGYRTIKFWQRPTNPVRMQLAAGVELGALAVSPSGDFYAVPAPNHAIRLISSKDSQVVHEFLGHTGPIQSLLFNKDGSTLVSGSEDQTIRVWNIAEKKLVAQIDTPSAVRAVELREDGMELYSGGADNLVRIWKMPAAPPKILAQASEGIRAVATSVDQKWLAVAGSTQGPQHIDIYDLTTGQLARTLQGHAAPVISLSFSQNAGWLISGSEDKSAKVWEFSTGRLAATIFGIQDRVKGAAINPNGTQALLGGTDGRITQYKLDVPAERKLGGDNPKVAQVSATSADGKQLATAAVVDNKNVVLVIDIASGNVTKTLSGHEGAIRSLAFSPDASRIASGSDDKTARVFSLGESKELGKFALHTQAVTAVAFNGNNDQVVSGSADNSLKLWNVADGTELKNFAGHTGAISGVTQFANGQLASSSADQTIRFWNPADGAQIRAIGIGQAIGSFDFSPDFQKVVVTGTDNSVRIMNANDGNLLFTLNEHAGKPVWAGFSSDNLRVASVGEDKVWCVWDVMTGKLLESQKSEQDTRWVSFGSTPQELLVARGDAVYFTTLHVERAYPAHQKGIVEILYNAGGDVAYSASEDGIIRRYATGNGQQQFETNHGAQIFDLDLSPDGQFLASAGENKQIRVWNAGNGGNAPKPVLEGFEGAVKSVSFIANGKYIAGGSDDKKIRIYDRDQGTLDQLVLGHTASIDTLASLGESLLSAGADKIVLSTATASIRQIPGHGMPITGLASFTPPNGQLISSSADNTIRVWNIGNGQQIRAFDQGAPVTGLALRTDGQFLVTTGMNNTARLWNVGNGQLVVDIRGDYKAQRVVAKLTADDADTKNAINNGNNAIKAAETDLTAKVEAQKKAQEAKTKADETVTAAQNVVNTATEKLKADKTALDGNKDDANLKQAVANSEKALTDANTELKKQQDAQTSAVKGLELANRAMTEAQTLLDQSKKKVEMLTTLFGQIAAELMTAQAASMQTEIPARGVAFSPDGKLFAVSSENGSIRTYSTVDGSPLETYLGHQGPVRALRFSSQQTLVSGGNDQTVRTWELAPEWKLVGQFGPPADKPNALIESTIVDRVLCLDFSPDGKLLASGGGDPSRSGELMIWNMESKSLLRSLPDAHSDTVFGLQFSTNGTQIVSGAADKFVKLFEVSTGKLVKSFEGHTHHVMDVSFKYDSAFIASAGADNAVKIWNVETGEQHRTIQGYTKQVTSIQYLGRGPNILSGSGDTTVRFHQAENGNNFRNFGGSTDYVYCVVGSFDEKFVASGGADGILRIWNGTNGQQILMFEPPVPPMPETQASAK